MMKMTMMMRRRRRMVGMRMSTRKRMTGRRRVDKEEEEEEEGEHDEGADDDGMTGRRWMDGVVEEAVAVAVAVAASLPCLSRVCHSFGRCAAFNLSLSLPPCRVRPQRRVGPRCAARFGGGGGGGGGEQPSEVESFRHKGSTFRVDLRPNVLATQSRTRARPFWTVRTALPEPPSDVEYPDRWVSTSVPVPWCV
jgi:hypothetical protein